MMRRIKGSPQRGESQGSPPSGSRRVNITVGWIDRRVGVLPQEKSTRWECLALFMLK